ncbi:MAG: MBL fold metallo-hydrolase [Thermodesulfobacteriota bacterium]
MAEQVMEGVWWIPGRDEFLPDSHMYVIGVPGSGDFSLVDCGLMGKGEYKLEEIDRLGIAVDQVKRIIMTHTHLDHIGCLPELLSAIPRAEVWVHEEEARYLKRGDERVVYGNPMFQSMVRAQYDIPKEHFCVDVHRTLQGDEEVSLGGIEFKVIHVPGHSAGCIGLFNEEHRLFFSGDTIYADGAIGRYDLVSADPAQLRQSLESIAELGIDVLLPCHNRIVKVNAAPMIRQTVEQWAPFLTS